MVYNYTRPRGPIAAMYSSPGPCYQLPNLVGYPNHDTRSTHVREPQWSFGVKHGEIMSDCSPGPCHLPTEKIYNTGKDGAPHYSLYGRQKEGMIYANPGPGAYCPTSSDVIIYPRQPAYSLSSRHKSFKTDDVPGPNVYSVDPMLGRTCRSQKPSAPIYSLSSRTRLLGNPETPGAGAYKITPINIYKESLPTYSITARHQLPTDSTRKPGPGAYKPETVYINRKSAPQFSFGIRHSQYKGEFITDVDAE
ncbi:Outer dense fiber of sperm tails protein 3 [Fasciola hepatica]|uniref:Outer dense fiber of sperm tails protein 3 n=1 Tax=Fasciola hepatica TaxID=6192 RepID=A0A4E0RG48_FASHE|nr:Outer dense fiber of sperm tails protein 3 [Fasciola hepatica]